MTRTFSLWAGTAALVIGLFWLALSSISVVSAASELIGGASMAGGEVTLTSNSDPDPTNDFSVIRFDDANGTTFASLATLSASYNVTDDDCGGGSPRFQIRIDENSNGIVDASDGNIFVHFGPSPSFTNCLAGWQSTGNVRLGACNRTSGSGEW